MPCSDGGFTTRAVLERNKAEKKKHEKEFKNRARIACAALTYIESLDGEHTGADFDDFLERTDWHEAGITKENAVKWWEKHKREDEARREIERQKREEAEKKQKARQRRKDILAAMSPEDRALFEKK